MLICCVGMLRSGSTWQYNAIRELLGRLGRGEAHGFFPEDQVMRCAADLRAWACDSAAHVVKTHARYDPGREALEQGQVRIAYTLRDPRDAAVSMRRAFHARGERLWWLLEDARRTYYWVSGLSGMPLIQRYEEFTADAPRGVREIAAYFGWPADAATVQAVVDACSVSAMRPISNALSRAAARHPLRRLYWLGWQLNHRFPIKKALLQLGFSPARWVRVKSRVAPYDDRTLLQPGHISSGAGGREKGLSRREQREILARFGAWLRDAGYPAPPQSPCLPSSAT